MKQYYVYILTNQFGKPFYTGVTSDLIKRTYEHKNGTFDGFSKRYNLHRLVYYEIHNDISEAIIKEKRIKKWTREYKVDLIKSINPDFKDLWDDIVGIVH